jgi:NADH-quinone oxidoreductase subunit G
MAVCYYSRIRGSGGKYRCCLVSYQVAEADPRPMPKLVTRNWLYGRMEVNGSSTVTEARKAVTRFLFRN